MQYNINDDFQGSIIDYNDNNLPSVRNWSEVLQNSVISSVISSPIHYAQFLSDVVDNKNAESTSSKHDASIMKIDDIISLKNDKKRKADFESLDFTSATAANIIYRLFSMKCHPTMLAIRSALTSKGRIGITRRTLAIPQFNTSIRLYNNNVRLSASILDRQRSLLHCLGAYARLIRIPIIAMGIYSIGYHQGVIESHRNPYRFQQQLLEKVTESKHSDICTEDELLEVKKKKEKDIKLTRQVAQVAMAIVNVAKIHVRTELEKARQAVKDQFIQENLTDGPLPYHVNFGELLEEAYEKNEDVQFWLEAQTRMEGDAVYQVEPWKFVFIEDKDPNAFVTEMLPRRIFIHTGLLNFSKTVDEVAFVVAHELSHLIHGHSSEKNSFDLALKAAEILSLSIDPSAGLVILAVVGVIATIGKFFRSEFSQDCEREADTLGVKLATLACFDAKAGSKMMYRLDRMYEETRYLKWLESHPSSIERAQNIYKLSDDIKKDENFKKCDKETCKAASQARILFELWQRTPTYV